ncbi:MAG TPA: hypothetical protein VLA61_15145 [Ideonella sp.]|uniref:hypothetical protein n=1 Tax=Ideonella sp. TaxID=1929293 RepID=UPI002BCDC883|nr:hypothetical protein [Ideonella sp.]HSI49607.1 hypothetical protein [Ideonella sp.]
MSTTPNTTPTSSTISGAANAAADKAASVVQPVAEAVAKEAARFGEMAESWWTRNAQMAKSAAVHVKDEAAALNDRTQRYVRDEPVKSMLVAAAVGAALTGLIVLLAKQRDR